MTEQPLVSIIINCFNSEKYLKDTINSVQSQTYSNFEVIFWDNYSTDTTPEIIKSYHDPRFKYYHANEHTTLGEARNLAMGEIKGCYFCFLDSDDVWDPDYLKNEIEVFNKYDNIIAVFSNYYLWEKGEKKVYNSNQKSQIHSLKAVLLDYKIGMSACIMKTNIASSNHVKFDNNYQLIEDMDFFIKMLEYGDFYYDSNPLCSYRVNPESSTYRLKNKWAGEYKSLYDKLKVKYIESGANVLDQDDIKHLKIREISYLMEDCIDKNNKIELLRLLINNKFMPFRYCWSRYLFLLFGKKIYTILRRH